MLVTAIVQIIVACLFSFCNASDNSTLYYNSDNSIFIEYIIINL